MVGYVSIVETVIILCNGSVVTESDPGMKKTRKTFILKDIFQLFD